jgi:hypothetical protein
VQVQVLEPRLVTNASKRISAGRLRARFGALPLSRRLAGDLQGAFAQDASAQGAYIWRTVAQMLTVK